MDNIKDPRIIYLRSIIQEYINAISCIGDSFSEVNGIFFEKYKGSHNNMLKFLLKLKPISEDDLINKLESKPNRSKEFHNLDKNIERSRQAMNIFPQSMFISIVSQFDVLIAQLIKFIYLSFENKLLEIEDQIQYRDVFKIGDIEKIKEKLIDKKIDSILRESHSKQMREMGKIIGVNLDKSELWGDFIEMTQRRNLFVHCKGVVSSQYIDECKKEKCKIDESLLGQTLKVDKDYFNLSFFVFYCIGVLTSQIILRKLLEKEKTLLEQIDSVLNNIIYEAICEKKYDIAIKLSEFALSERINHANRQDEKFFVLNYAQAYKWKGDKKKCMDILEKNDFSESKEDILVAKYALEDDIDNVIKSMRSIGDSSTIMDAEAYSTWEIFKEMREKDEFKNTFEDIFKKPLFDPDMSNIGEQTKEILDEVNSHVN